MSYSVVEMFNFSMTGLCTAVARVSALRSSFNRVNHEWQHIKDIEKFIMLLLTLCTILRDFENASPLISCFLVNGWNNRSTSFWLFMDSLLAIKSVAILCKTDMVSLMTSYRPNPYETILLISGLLLPFKFATSWCVL